MSRILAIDYGSKRTGLAVTDPGRIIATALDTIDTPKLMAYLKNYIGRESVTLIIVGEPKHKDGNPMEVSHLIEKFIITLKRDFEHIPVEREDERYTSKRAFDAMIQSGIGKEKRKDKKLVDKIAAVIILQNYLERKTYE